MYRREVRGKLNKKKKKAESRNRCKACLFPLIFAGLTDPTPKAAAFLAPIMS